MTETLESYIDIVRQLLDETKGGHIVTYHLKGSSITDYAIIVSANNAPHCQALMKITEKIKSRIAPDNNDLNLPPKVSGDPKSGWVIVDLNSVIIHIVLDDIRQHYQLDDVFSDRSEFVQHM